MRGISKFATLCLLRVVAVQVVRGVYLAKLIAVFHLLACVAHRPMDGHPVVRDARLLGSADPALRGMLQFVLMRLLVALLLLIKVDIVGNALFLAVGRGCLGQSLVHLLRHVVRLRLVQGLLATGGLHSVMPRIGGDILIIIYEIDLLLMVLVASMGTPAGLRLGLLRPLLARVLLLHRD